LSMSKIYQWWADQLLADAEYIAQMIDLRVTEEITIFSRKLRSKIACFIISNFLVGWQYLYTMSKKRMHLHRLDNRYIFVKSSRQRSAKRAMIILIFISNCFFNNAKGAWWVNRHFSAEFFKCACSDHYLHQLFVADVLFVRVMCR
jgi:hypothetical protein